MTANFRIASFAALVLIAVLTLETHETDAATPASNVSNTACTPITLTAEKAGTLGVSTWYKKICDEKDIPIFSSASTSNKALIEEERLMRKMLELRPALFQYLRDTALRSVVIGKTEFTTQIPEYSMLPIWYPETNWDVRTRGLGATMWIPVVSASEENLLCLPGDPYTGESVFIHEFAHSVMNMGLTYTDPTFIPRLTDTYRIAMEKGLWKGTYAATNIDEYWAEGVQSYFNANQQPTVDGIHNEINTRAELKSYDYKLWKLIREAFGESSWRYSCPK